MHFSEIDRCCDQYEAQLRAGEKLSIQNFLHANGLPSDAGLIAELERVAREYSSRQVAAVPPVASPGPTVSMPADEPVSKTIGPYKLLQKLGEGGMGVVYMAEQSRPVARRVALKIIKPGLDTKQVLARFEAERQALALMDHPNIARVLDVGTTDDGRPFFVMELVKGIPITKYCDEKRLTPRERLELFVPICQAVQHAHHKGVIHRDIKPTNVLVAELDGKPVPKIIDFGLAKAISQKLTEQTLFTQFGTIMGTIDYMSPEQASFNQLDVDTRSDVYSLGVLMYELLTGETPFDRKRMHQAALDEVLRIIRHEEPPRPSTRLSSHATLPAIAASRRMEPKKLSFLVRGELDWIVMKALEKERSRRYETANGLALDVQRYLNDEEIAASPPSMVYRLRKLIRRNRSAVAGTAVVLLGLLIAAASVGWSIKDRSNRYALAEAQVESTLEEVYRLEAESRWSEALEVAEQASAIVTANELYGAEIADDVIIATKELEFVHHLEHIRLTGTLTDSVEIDSSTTAKKYAVAFLDFAYPESPPSEDDFDILTLDQFEFAQRLKLHLRIVVPMAEAIDQWAHAIFLAGGDRKLERWLSTLASKTDSDTFRNELRRFWQEPVTNETQQRLVVLQADFDAADYTPGTCNLLASTLFRFGLDALELPVLQEALESHPDDFWLNYDLADYHWHDGQFDKAVRYLTSAVAIRPDEAHVQEYLSQALRSSGEIDEADSWLLQAADLAPISPAGYNGLAWALATWPEESKRNPRLAIALSEWAIEMNSNNLDYHSTLGVAHYRAGNWPKAFELLQSCVNQRADPGDQLFLAMAKWQLGRKVEARTDLDNALQWLDSNVDTAYSSEEVKRFREEAETLINGSRSEPCM